MKALMMIPLWGRPEIVKLFAYNLPHTMPDYFELIPLFILSPEDEHFKELKQLTKKYYQFEYKNYPLGEKKNAGLNYAMSLEWDYYIDCGSDNIWTPKVWEIYKPYFEANNEYFGLQNNHVLDAINMIGLYVSKYHLDVYDTPTALGVLRTIRRDIVEKNLLLWRHEWHHGMDGCSHFKLMNNGVNCTVIDTDLPLILDVKTMTNLTLFSEVVDNAIKVDTGWLLKAFGLSKYDFIGTNHTELLTFEGFRGQVLKLRNQFSTQKDAFDAVNTTYELEFGEKKYANYQVYLNKQTRKLKK